MIIHSQHPDSHYIIHPLIYERSIESRAYQKNIAESAFDKNALVILPTALGKTIIAIMLTARTLYTYRRKRVMVVAPTRPLVLQHMKSFFSVLKLSQDKVAEITGKTPPLPRTAIWNYSDSIINTAIPTKYNDTMRAIVFTQYRDTARHIVDILNSNNITASRFVGQAKKEGDIGMKQEEQAQILEAFRRGEFSVLVATSIAEEGLDIPEVDLVIFYEPIPSEIRYIQRRGRTGRRSSGSVIILAAKDTIDERHLNASKRRIEKMSQTLSTIESVLKSTNRIISFTPIPDLMTSEEIAAMEVDRSKFEVNTVKAIEMQTTSTLTKGVPKYVSLLEKGYTSQFVRDVNNATRKIHSLLVKKGRIGEDVDIIRDTLGFDNNILVEALKKLEKLKRIKWLDDVTIALSDSLKHLPGEVHDIYIENILSGITLVIIDGKWHARLNHYDYEGPRHLLKKGMEFKAISELYHDRKAFCVRIKQIV
jgi:superfamily II DNA/RNA helicase